MMPGQQPIDWDAVGYPELADAIRKDAGGAVARGDQADAAEAFAVSELRSIAAEPNAVIIAEATQELSARIARIEDRHREFRSHGAMLHVGRTGPVEPDPRKPSGVGVLFADDPRFVCDLSPDYPLRGVLHAWPVDRETRAAVRLARRVPLHPARERLCVRMACTVRSCLAGLHLLRALDLRMALGHRFEPGSAER